MSHTTTITGLRVTDLRALAAAVARIQGARLEILPAPQDRRLYQAAPIPSVVASVKLPGWMYPVHVDKAGALHYDNYKGNWGAPRHLDTLKQSYATERARALAKSQGYTVRETQKQDGSLVLTLTR